MDKTRGRAHSGTTDRLPEHHEAVIKWAMIALMARRLARNVPPAQPARTALAAAA